MIHPRIYLKDRWITIPAGLGLIIQIIMWEEIIRRLSASGFSVFIHYTSLFGFDLVGEWWGLLFLPGSGLALLFLTYGAAFFMHGSERLPARLLSLFALASQIGLLIAAWLIIGLNG